MRLFGVSFQDRLGPEQMYVFAFRLSFRLWMWGSEIRSLDINFICKISTSHKYK